MISILLFLTFLLVHTTYAGALNSTYGQEPGFQNQCTSIQNGYHCREDISRHWGPYTPYYHATSALSSQEQCEVTFAQVLSRHGARYPTTGAKQGLQYVVYRVKKTAKKLPGKYAFLQRYKWTFKSNSLTIFGQEEMYDSGVDFYVRYKHLAEKENPFLRASSSKRVIMSGMNFTQGFLTAKGIPSPSPLPIVVVKQGLGYNCTLSLGSNACPAFQLGHKKSIKLSISYAKIFTVPIVARLNKDMGTSLTGAETIALMSMCPFDTVATPTGTISPFCALFTPAEWGQYNHYQSLLKYEGFGAGAILGPTQGVGWVNELIARLTNKPVNDQTTTNSTLDSNPATFPLGRKLYADFSHDSQMTAIMFAMHLYPAVAPGGGAGAYNSATSVPFAARMYVEKMRCGGPGKPELVRVLINGRVVPLRNCGADAQGRCELGRFVESLAFARKGGHWGRCYKGLKLLKKPWWLHWLHLDNEAEVAEGRHGIEKRGWDTYVDDDEE